MGGGGYWSGSRCWFIFSGWCHHCDYIGCVIPSPPYSAIISLNTLKKEGTLTLAEKILAAHTDKKEVSPGEFISVRVDLILANDITAPIAIREFRRIGVDRVFDPKKIVMVPDHFVPNKDIASAEQAKLMREFCYEQGIIYFEVGQSGTCAFARAGSGATR
jgi:homoaconitase/3-isopropylmalate dehydratase large subunit